ncbi:tetratricopeptide repeat protein [Sediminibacillus albus]|uniref:Tetratricopeptide repeat-containing protein n=1 Tax=Sediminibacillus albus TaxID=407036 RepID=A0A1G8YS35_9BACI|nr:tetratricopeptide repeat protein [Sediminibacillus albus]SDK04885.1 Tetratricopeptide repeat-containing protein [Sediminibacillus albus]
MHTPYDVKAPYNVDKVIPFIPEGDFYFTKGVEAFQKRKFDIAVKWLKKAIESSPDEALFQCQLSIIYTEVGAYHAANQVLTDVLTTHGNDYIDCYYLIANNYAHLGLMNDAMKNAQKYLDIAPDGDFTSEAEELLNFLDLDEEDEDWADDLEDELLIFQETAFYHLEREEWDEAIPLLHEMMALFPDHLPAKHEYSYALFFSGDEDEAIRLEQQWLDKDPQSLFCHTNLALFYYHRQEKERFTDHVEAVANVYPIHDQQKLRVAVTLARTENYQAALQRFKGLSKYHLKGHASFFKWYSIAAFQTGNPSKALALWEEGCKQHPFLSKYEGPWIHN